MTDVRFPILDSMKDNAPRWTRGAFDALLEKAGRYDESKHPRHPKGSAGGGKFAPKGGKQSVTNAPVSLQVRNIVIRGKSVPFYLLPAGGSLPETLAAQLAKTGDGTFHVTFNTEDQKWYIPSLSEADDLTHGAYSPAISKKFPDLVQVRGMWDARRNELALYDLYDEVLTIADFGGVSPQSAEYAVTQNLKAVAARPFFVGKRAPSISIVPFGEMTGSEASDEARARADIMNSEIGTKSFDAAKHPRHAAGTPQGGKFAPKGEGSVVVIPSTPAHPNTIIATLGHPPPDVYELEGGTLLRAHKGAHPDNIAKTKELFLALPEAIRRGLKTLTLRADAGPLFKAGGKIYTTGGDYNPANKGLRTFANAKPKSRAEIAYLLNHETGHHLYHRFGELTLAERNLAKTTSTPVGGAALTDEALIYGEANDAPEYQAAVQTARSKYPYLAARRDFIRAVAQSNGITSYAESWKKEGGGIGADETFAEMTRFYMDDVHHQKTPLYRFYEPTHPQYPKRAVADAYLKILNMMQNYDANPATKSFMSAPASAGVILKFFDAFGNECGPEDGVMAEMRRADGSSVIFFAENDGAGAADLSGTPFEGSEDE